MRSLPKLVTRSRYSGCVSKPDKHALNDAEALVELAKVRLDAVPGSVGTLSLANGYYCAECGITVICNPDREDMQTKSVLCTGCWLRAGEELRERRMGRG
jgi:DNA-directed RNA polymerase subunit RPC12/RpoP